MRATRSLPAPIAVVGSLAAAAAAACGSSGSLASTGGYASGDSSAAQATPDSAFETVAPLQPMTPAALQALIAAQVGARVPAGTPVAVTCPAAPSAVGSTVHCTATIAGTKVDWTATSRAGAIVDSEPAAGLLVVADARHAVAALFTDYTNPTVDCGPGVVVVVKTDDELACTIVSGSREHSAHVVVTDQFGHFQATP